MEEHDIPVIKGATVNGVVEIARGCGRGCDFCVPTLRRYRCLAIKHIMKEVEVNLRAGRQPLLHAEDVLRYGAKGIEANREALINLFKSVMSLPGIESINISHFALSTVAASPEIVEEISNILQTREDRWLSGQTGIETGSPELMRRHMVGKCKPYKPEEWPEVVLNAFQILADNNWVPCSTLILGLPGEDEKDLEATISLVEKLEPFKSLIVPLFVVSMGGLMNRYSSFTLEQMTPKHTELLLRCWQHNLEWIPTILREWSEFSVKNRIIRHGLSILVSYGVKKAKRLIQICERDYNYDLQTMIRDFRRGSRVVPTSLPVRLLRPLLNISV